MRAAAVLLLVGVLCTVGSAQCPDYSYSGNNGPSHWGSLCPEYATCGNGTAQSPINLQLHTSHVARFSVDLDYEPTANLPFRGLEHTVEVTYEGVADSILNLGPLGPVPYTLAQFHFHTPSEHAQDGQLYDMEMHFVHAGPDGDLLVLGLWVEESDDSCDFLEQLVGRIPNEGEVTSVDVASVFQFSEGTPIFRYSGSLTTPPCTEGVTWLIPADAVSCTSAQVQAFREALGQNNRPLQDRNSRVVQLSNVNNYSTLSSFTTAYDFFTSSSSSSSASTIVTSAALVALSALLLLA